MVASFKMNFSWNNSQLITMAGLYTCGVIDQLRVTKVFWGHYFSCGGKLAGFAKGSDSRRDSDFAETN